MNRRDFIATFGGGLAGMSALGVVQASPFQQGDDKPLILDAMGEIRLTHPQRPGACRYALCAGAAVAATDVQLSELRRLRMPRAGQLRKD